MYRIVCTKLDGSEPDVYQAEDEYGAVCLAEQIREGINGEYHRVKVQVECPKHGWTTFHDGKCDACQWYRIPKGWLI